MLWITDVLTREIAGWPAGTPVCGICSRTVMPYDPNTPQGWAMGIDVEPGDLASPTPEQRWITRTAACFDNDGDLASGLSDGVIEVMTGTDGVQMVRPTQAELARMQASAGSPILCVGSIPPDAGFGDGLRVILDFARYDGSGFLDQCWFRKGRPVRGRRLEELRTWWRGGADGLRLSVIAGSVPLWDIELPRAA